MTNRHSAQMKILQHTFIMLITSDQCICHHYVRYQVLSILNLINILNSSTNGYLEKLFGQQGDKNLRIFIFFGVSYNLILVIEAQMVMISKTIN